MSKLIGSLVAKAGLSILLLSFCGGTAFADLAFDVAGSTDGQFYLGSTNLALGDKWLGLEFEGAAFGPTKQEQINLGTFTLDTLVGWFDPFDFRLSVNFVAPSTAGTVFHADLSGVASYSFFGGPKGSATVDFANNGPRHFDFTNSVGSGSFDLSITDVKVVNGSTASLIGTISNATFATTPEPASIVLTTMLLGGVLVLFRKRLKAC